ncbi:unnamed protein product [Rhizoctonia solani]|uniref:Fungal lipase-type domain-containing protein n=1 Tax=Rhizoctonia solani TaxID=456999 RepID=A0A8H3BHG8_9AGAM|nr:unnamed protein product [Rhizoctonia solani]
MSAATISTYAPYASLASAAYCSTASTWTCAQCKSLPEFVTYATGGDGDAVPKWYVGWWPTQSTVVVGHQGTNPAQLESLLTDAEVVMSSLSSSLFPGVSGSVKAHDGFMKAQADTATNILAGVKGLLSTHSASKVLVIGHSLGGAIATLDALYFKLNLPSTVSIKAVTFGLPRVGNQDFANLIDSEITDFLHVTNEKDLVPIIPGESSTEDIPDMPPGSPGPPRQGVFSDTCTQAAKSILLPPARGMLASGKIIQASIVRLERSRTSLTEILMITLDLMMGFT